MKRSIVPTFIIAVTLSAAFAQAQPIAVKEKSTSIQEKQLQQVTSLTQRFSPVQHTQNTQLLQEKVYSVQAGEGLLANNKTRYNWHNGNIGSIDQLVFTGGVWVEASRERFTYNQHQMVQSFKEVSYSGVWHPISRIDYEYGYHFMNGTLVHIDQLEWSVSDNDWVLLSRDRTFLNEQGEPTGGIEHNFIHGAWVPVSQWEMTYSDEQETIITEQMWIEFDGMPGFWMNTTRTVFPNMSPAELEQVLREMMDDQAQTLGENAFYKMPPHTVYEWFYEEWVPVSRVVRTNEYHWLTGEYISSEVTMENFLMDGWLPEKRYRVQFNDFAKEQSINIDLWIEDWYHFNRNEFQYNEQGHLVNMEERINLFGQFYLVGAMEFQWSQTPTSNEPLATPNQFELGRAYPNPFNPSTSIPFELKQSGAITMTVYDILGRQVKVLAQGVYPAGQHTIQFNAVGLPSGVYLVRMEAKGYSSTQKINLVK